MFAGVGPTEFLSRALIWTEKPRFSSSEGSRVGRGSLSFTGWSPGVLQQTAEDNAWLPENFWSGLARQAKRGERKEGFFREMMAGGILAG